MRLAPFELERYFARYEFTAEYLLSSSDCESWSIGELLALEPGAQERFAGLRLGYTETRGAEALRREICRLYTSIEPHEVLVHSGAEEGIFLLLNAALEEGDHAVIHQPCYASLTEVARATGCEVTPWLAEEQRGWALDPDDLSRHLRPKTRLVILNSPHNPTGFAMPQEGFREIFDLARRRGIRVFSDEVYRESEHRPEDRLPAACDLDERAVSLGVLSKTYGLPGLRIGWIATHDADLRARMEALKDYTTICNSAPSELLAELALRHRETLVERNVDLLGHNLELVDAFLARWGERFSWVRPKAGPVGFPRLLDGNVETFCHELVTTAGVLLLPGSLFGDRGNHFRIGFGRRNLPQALARFEEHLESSRP